MFGSFLNLLYPANKFITSVLKILKYDPSTYNADELTAQMNEKEQCELLNSSIDINELNKSIKLKKFFIGNCNIKKSTFIFKRNYMMEKTILSFEDINIDIMNKIEKNAKKENNEEGEKKASSEGGLLDNLINTVVHNLVANFKNIKIRFFDKENKNVEYTFFIKKIEYKENENAEPIRADEKIKYLFLHNKALFIDGLLFKEKYEDKDDIFFSEEEKDKDNKNTFISQNNNLFYIKNKIEIDLFYNKDNYYLTISNNNKADFYIENIFNVKQLKSLYKYFSCDEEDINNDIIKEKNENINNISNNDKKEEKKGVNLMGYKIEKFNFEIKIWLFYFLLMENDDNNENKDKLWISHQENLIKNDEINNNINNVLINHFNSSKKKYYIFDINDLLFVSKTNQTNINEIILKLIEPNNNDHKNIININKFIFNLESKELLYDNIYFEITPYLLHFIKNLLPKKSAKNKNVNKLQNKEQIENKELNNNKEINNDNEINTDNNKKVNEEKNNFKFNGKNFNIKIFLNNDNNEGNNKKDISSIIDDIFTNKDKNNYIDFIISNLNIQKEENINISYDNINLSYNDKDDNKYPILKILEAKNKSEIKGININCYNEISIDLQFQILIFINPELVKNISNYAKFISQIYKMKENKNIINNDININQNNNIINDENNNLEKIINKNIFFKLKEIKIYIINEKESYLNVEQFFVELPTNKVEDKKKNDYICIHLNEIGAKLENYNNNIMKCNTYLKSFIIEDNISESIYKILLSHYYFKNKENIFINCDFEIKKLQGTNKYEIKPKIKITPIAIYLDQISLYYFYNVFNQMKEKKENENNNEKEKEKENNNIKNNNINKNDNIIFNNTNIDCFFIQINYSNNSNINDQAFLNNTIIRLLNSISLTNLNIDLREYKKENSKLPMNEAIKDIYEFYFNDIKSQIQSGSLLPALPLFNHFFNIIDGAFDIVREPIKNYRNNESFTEGFVHGIHSFVVKTTSFVTHLGEPIVNYLNSFSCVRKTEDDDNHINFCRGLRHKFNEKDKEIEEYYFK